MSRLRVPKASTLHFSAQNQSLAFQLHVLARSGSQDMADLLRIMVVEDDQSIQSIVEEALSDGGFEPAIASSGEEALMLLSGSKYRVLVIDIKLGKDRIRGWDVARRARAINPELPVVYITGANANEWAMQGVPNSILLTKPFAPAQLVAAVSQLLNTGTPTT
jgi:DNA-binding response OmpR family regulator